MSELAYRPAVIGDAADIHALLLKVADEIPVLVDTLEREEALYAIVRNCVRTGESWVAEDGGNIIGFLLVEPNQLERFWGENEVLDLRYAGTGPNHRGKGVFPTLLSKAINRMVVLTAVVKDANKSSMVARLKKAGFRQAETRVGEQHFRREP
ncbi:MAG TPA: GNAT family N-acetyltransferase [Stellaceae bacterium]|nr:GNAT family N-acetyltransferase [Stellaceae bacterium]